MKILYISFFYPPFNTIGGLRAYGQVQALREFGCEVKVLTSRNQGFEKDKSSSFSDIDTYYFGSPKSLNTDNTLEKIKFIKNLMKLPKFINRYLYLLRFLLIGEEEGWKKEVINNYQELLKGWHPDLIFSSQSPISSHQLASKISSQINIKWVAEFRDSWSFNPMAFSHSEGDISSIIMRYLEKKILKNCSLILAATNFIKDYYERHYDLDTYLLTGGWDLSDTPSKSEPREESRLKITHLGSMLYGRRSLMPIIDILNKNSRISDKFYFEFVGRHTSLFQKELDKGKSKNSLRLKEQVSYKEAEKIGFNTDILLILMMDSPQEKYTLTGKIFDYIKYHKPILIVDPFNSEASNLINEYKMGHVFKNYKDFEYFLEKSDGIDSFKRINKIDRDSFNRSQQIKKLINFFQSNL